MALRVDRAIEDLAFAAGARAFALEESAPGACLARVGRLVRVLERGPQRLFATAEIAGVAAFFGGGRDLNAYGGEYGNLRAPKDKSAASDGQGRELLGLGLHLITATGVKVISAAMQSGGTK
jgi:hypothetical protein